MGIFRKKISRSRSTQPSTSKTSEFEQAKYPILAAPFHGAVVPVMVRELTQAQALACGNFSLIETFEDSVRKKNAKFKTKDVLAYTDRNHEIAKASLVHPTYEELLAMVGKDSLVAESKRKLDELEEKAATLPVGKERAEIEGRIDSMRIWVDLILPEDFLAFVVCYALGIDKSDIKKVSEDMLVNAAVLAELGHDNPSDHIGGKFTDFMRDDINTRAWILLAEKRKKEKQSA